MPKKTATATAKASRTIKAPKAASATHSVSRTRTKSVPKALAVSAEAERPKGAAPKPFDISVYRAEIAQEAYFNWLNRQGAPGSPDQDWQLAEQQIRTKYASA